MKMKLWQSVNGCSFSNVEEYWRVPRSTLFPNKTETIIDDHRGESEKKRKGN